MRLSHVGDGIRKLTLPNCAVPGELAERAEVRGMASDVGRIGSSHGRSAQRWDARVRARRAFIGLTRAMCMQLSTTRGLHVVVASTGLVRRR